MTRTSLWMAPICVFAGLLAGTSFAEDPSEPAPAPLSLAWCLERAERANPEIAVDAAAAEAALHRIIPAGALEDPRTAYQASNVPIDDLDFSSTPMSGNQLNLAQKFPFPGVLANREEAAKAAFRAASERVEDRRVQVRAAVERAWSELGFAQRALDITDRNIDLLRQLTDVAEAKYRVGRGLQQDVLRAQVALTGLLQERLRRIAAIRAAEARLSSLLDLPPETSFPRTEPIRDVSPMPALSAVLAGLESENPRLRALAASIAEAEKRRAAVRLEGFPDFDIGLGYRIRQRVPGDPVIGQDFLIAGVTVRLPINRRKWRERIAEQESLLRRARFAYAAERARLRDAVRAAYADLERADDEVRLVETGLVPQAAQSLESSRSGYQVDKVDFLSLIDSQVRLQNAELSLVRALADRRKAYASLEAATGKELR